MGSSRDVDCKAHGRQPAAFLCQHLMRSIDTQVAVGFHWSSQDPGPTPDAWCSACDEARVAAGGDWTDELYKLLSIKLVCASCYGRAKDVWLRVQKTDRLSAL